MPFPWKKAKGTRISRLVSDLHQTPKRGGSLVVETGFPTSLIDLFHKNRDRLRKPSTSKRKHNCSSFSHQTQIQTPPPADLPRPPPPPPCVDHPQPQPLSTHNIDAAAAAELVFDVGKECDDERIKLRAAFKIFLVVALAVSTKSLAIWVMIAAFLLVLIDFVGAHFLGQSEVWVKRVEVGSPAEELEENNSCRVEEIQQVSEPEFDSVSESEGSETQTVKIREILACKSERSSRRARIKENLKKLVSKKQKKKQDKTSPQKLLEIEEAHDNDDDADEPKLVVAVEEEEVEVEAVESCEQQVEEVEEEKGRESKRKSGYLILFLIVALAGLMGGRGLALSLTLLWCLVLRYTRPLKRCSNSVDSKPIDKKKAEASSSL